MQQNFKGSQKMPELWKSVADFEAFYEVSNYGRIRSLREHYSAKSRDRILRPNRKPNGYLGIQLSVNGDIYSFQIHRLVMAAFVGPVPEGQEIDHIDGNKTNNILSNLRYVTRSQHAKLHIADGRRKVAFGEHHPQAKLLDSQILEIRRLCSEGMTQIMAAKAFGVGRSQITKIVNRQRRTKAMQREPVEVALPRPWPSRP
jgi:HNH endonuclease/NUMOD4 motif-containing protein